MPFGNFGMTEILLILLVLLLVFGARRLPELGGALGKGIREFKRSIRDIESELARPTAESQKELNAGSTEGAAAPAEGAARKQANTGRDSQ
ncbi:MAG: twin-arginine translocase TatA/TatE family subunit [Gemmatimonadetes bacterium]|nr:twin-arginine translocase TatA/TatE family subunit [Gemmatimonadota bacterium]